MIECKPSIERINYSFNLKCLFNGDLKVEIIVG